VDTIFHHLFSSPIIQVSVLILLSLGLYPISVQASERPSVSEGRKLYMHYCTPCHGIRGDGMGFNAENLDPRPANHTDSRFMSKRTDRDLYEVIKGGGRAVGKATLMPPWGGNLNDTQIKSLILYLRRLCMCKHE